MLSHFIMTHKEFVFLGCISYENVCTLRVGCRHLVCPHDPSVLPPLTRSPQQLLYDTWPVPGFAE